MRTPVAAGRRANPVRTLASTRAGVTKPRESNRIRCDEVVAQDHEDTIGNLAFDESASAGQRTPVESLVERSILGIAEEHSDIRRLANVLRSPAHELARMTLVTELREGEHRPDAPTLSTPRWPSIDSGKTSTWLTSRSPAARTKCVGLGSSQLRVRNRSSPLKFSPQTSRTKAQSWMSNSRGKSACEKTNS